MNKNQLTIVKEYEFDNLFIQKIDSLIDNSMRNCHHKYSHTFNHICEYDLKFTIFGNNESVNFKIPDKCMGMYELNKNLAIARRNGFIFNQIKKITIKNYSNRSNINIQYHLNLGLPPLHCQFFIKISHNRDYIQVFCNDRRNQFHFACRQWCFYNIPQRFLKKPTLFRIQIML